MAKASATQIEKVREALNYTVNCGYGTATIYDGRTGSALNQRGVTGQKYHYGAYSYPMRTVSRDDDRLHAEAYKWCVENGLGELADKYQAVQVKRAVDAAVPKYNRRIEEINAMIAKLEVEREQLIGKVGELNKSLLAQNSTGEAATDSEMVNSEAATDSEMVNSEAATDGEEANG